ncbi:MAG: PaaI family thioesterase [Prevotella sp.]|nr:PaaI family thioesterase [Prevotella sp.]
MKKIKNPWLHKEGYDCFGCCPDNPIGIHMEFYEDGEEIVSFWKPQQHFQGWIDTLHGGIQATLIDECAAWVVSRKLQTSGVTSKLEIKYRKAIMTTEPQITVRARLKEMHRNVAFIHIEIENAKGEVCTESDAVYFTFPKEKAAEMGFTHCDTEGEELLL